MIENEVLPERTLLVAIPKKGTLKEVVEEHLEELASLVRTAGGEVVDSVYQELVSFNPATAIGKGKVKEIQSIIQEKNINLVVFDDDLTPVQTKNLENEFQVKVIDRTTLILAIFAKHARTTEAKTQVELAQLQYLLPRLTRLWTHLSKQYGGIGTRGPGEKQIETDRRLVKARIQRLQKKLKEILIQKEIVRKQRINFFKFALVGYTNAGKSTIMRELTNANVLVEDKLFATLDTTTRAIRLPNDKIALLSDTVGFIRKLPAHLVASFRSTLAEVEYADVLIHVADASNRYFMEQISVVDETLENLKVEHKPRILVLNKIDLIQDKEYIRYLQKEFPEAILISAERGININALLLKMQELMEAETKYVKVFLPYDKMNLVPYIYKMSSIIRKEEKSEGIEFLAKLLKQEENYFVNMFQSYIQN
ncbi:GTPase HflX [Bacteroidetes/Chlorobi group bacterium Naka2016]|jgi:GTP-binding protein HflX|nr:MAG: GTPase HflX [Bacteroidetes/Chlorobi group bacterium Naka2016]